MKTMKTLMKTKICVCRFFFRTNSASKKLEFGGLKKEIYHLIFIILSIEEGLQFSFFKTFWYISELDLSLINTFLKCLICSTVFLASFIAKVFCTKWL